MAHNLFRELPSVNEILDSPGVRSLADHYSHDRLVTAIRRELSELRLQFRSGIGLNGTSAADHIARRVADRIGIELQPRLRSVINATGIVLHTNLGRAPISEEAARAAYEAARGYLNLEIDLESGKRSSRPLAVREWICQLTGAESATVVNNNAAATVIALRALCQAGEVVVSRGQLIEIGGSFRIPDIMAVSGAVLREVGTTNITRLSDYERAIGPRTAALMQIHPSNYRVSGFTKQVALADLVALGRKHNLKVIDDIGSGALFDFNHFGFEKEPYASQSIEAGADLVLFSGDKLLGGPQAGILAGRKEWIQKIEKDPLMRAFRLDKMTLASLEATLRIYLNPPKALQDIPILRMLGTPLKELGDRAEKLALQLRELSGILSVRVREDIAYVGGGSLPDRSMKTYIVEIAAREIRDAELARRLRTGTPPLMGRLREGNLILDLRTVFPHQEEGLVEAVRKATAPEVQPS